MIAAERRRQIKSEKWTAKHDDQRHGDGTLGDAASCYERCAKFQENFGRLPMEATDAFKFEPIGWPWDAFYFKLGGSAIRTYVKSGALFQAEVDRIVRLFKKRVPKKTDDVGRLAHARHSLDRITDALDRLLK